MGDDDFSQSGLPLNSQYTNEQIAELKKLRDKRSKTFRIVLAVVATPVVGFDTVVVIGHLNPMEILGISLWALILASVAAFLLVFAVAVYTSRCPGCNRMFWKKAEKPGCIYCGLDLGSPGALDV